jgi:hypothetical protein
MKAKICNILNSIFSSLLLIAILGGGIVFIMYVMALLIGGDMGETLALNAKNTVMPIFIRVSAIGILAGLISSYVIGQHSLSIDD